MTEEVLVQLMEQCLGGRMKERKDNKPKMKKITNIIRY